MIGGEISGRGVRKWELDLVLLGGKKSTGQPGFLTGGMVRGWLVDCLQEQPEVCRSSTLFQRVLNV